MISDEPDEDADNRDDGSALDTYLGIPPAGRNVVAKTVPRLPEWPPKTVREIGLILDAETLAWFQKIHVDWRRAMRGVLHAWVADATHRPIVVPLTQGTVATAQPEDSP
jgi:hypothetical protein